LDAGALIALERGDGRMLALMSRVASGASARFAVPAGVLAQVWRGGARQAVVARFLALPEVEVVALDEPVARAVGILCGVRRTRDPIDASVVVCAKERGDIVVTGDADDLRKIDPGLRILEL
jgi:hypothetical protein